MYRSLSGLYSILLVYLSIFLSFPQVLIIVALYYFLISGNVRFTTLFFKIALTALGSLHFHIVLGQVC